MSHRSAYLKHTQKHSELCDYIAQNLTTQLNMVASAWTSVPSTCHVGNAASNATHSLGVAAHTNCLLLLLLLLCKASCSRGFTHFKTTVKHRPAATGQFVRSTQTNQPTPPLPTGRGPASTQPTHCYICTPGISNLSTLLQPLHSSTNAVRCRTGYHYMV